MAMFVQTITSAQVLAALTNDTTKWNGADIEPPKLRMLEFWGTATETPFTSSSGTKTLGNVAIPAFSDLTIEAAYIGTVSNTTYNSFASPNHVDGAATLQTKESVSGSWTSGMTIEDNSYWINATTYLPAQVMQMGNTDVSSEISAFDKTYNFRILTAKAVGNNLSFLGLRPIIRLFVK